jgi:lipopolysaccharide transport system ATP-binding protein
MPAAIAVSHLSKSYRISHAGRPGTFTKRFGDLIRRPFRRANATTEETFWALRDVSFEVQPGEVVGIIGRNGAGKSTLLKILSRITAPTEGKVELRGRVASLLEVGTGFHPELTGRENVYMNGSILGMRRAEIDRKFDAIVDFSGVERFLEVPLKRYSSGMYVRLAFAVAAHLDPEILIVDEVLAVGDAEFQKKCLGTMKDAATSGRTVLFVSHNLSAVESLCGSGVVLRNGQTAFLGSQTEAIAHYVADLSVDRQDLMSRTDREGSGEITVTAVEVIGAVQSNARSIRAGDGAEIRLHYRAKVSRVPGLVVGVAIRSAVDAPVFLQHNALTGEQFDDLPPEGFFCCRIPALPLVPSDYYVTYSVMSGDRYVDRISDAAKFEVLASDYFGSGRLPPVAHGPVLVRASWRVQSSAVQTPDEAVELQ